MLTRPRTAPGVASDETLAARCRRQSREAEEAFEEGEPDPTGTGAEEAPLSDDRLTAIPKRLSEHSDPEMRRVFGKKVRSFPNF